MISKIPLNNYFLIFKIRKSDIKNLSFFLTMKIFSWKILANKYYDERYVDSNEELISREYRKQTIIQIIKNKDCDIV